MTAPSIPLEITRGKTFAFKFMYAQSELEYKTITDMPGTAPCRLTVPGHGIPDGWLVRISCVKSPAELNTGESFRPVRVIDQDTIELNDVNAHCLSAFSGDGLVIFYKPVDLAGWSARAKIRPKIDSDEVLYTWDPVQIDLASSAFILDMDPLTTEGLEWKTGVYDLEAVSPTGDVYAVISPSGVIVSPEVTRP